MLDLEDSIPRGDDAKLAEGRANVIRSFNTLDWGSRLRFFRPRGLALDPGARGHRRGRRGGRQEPRRPDLPEDRDARRGAQHRRDAHGARAQARPARGQDQHPGAHRERQRRGAGVRDRALVAAALGPHLRRLRLLGIAPDDRRAVPHRSSARRSRAGAHREGGGERQHPRDRRDDAQLPDEGEVRRREEGRARRVPARRRDRQELRLPRQVDGHPGADARSPSRSSRSTPPSSSAR